METGPLACPIHTSVLKGKAQVEMLWASLQHSAQPASLNVALALAVATMEVTGFPALASACFCQQDVEFGCC